MHKPSLILVGGGGHCRACIDVIVQQDKFGIEGILDHAIEPGTTIDGVVVLGNDDLIETWANKEAYFLVTVGQLQSAVLRKKLYERICKAGGRLATIVSPRAYVSNAANLSDGVIIMHSAIVNAGAAVGSNSIINTSALIEHDSIVGKHVHISTMATVNGGCTIGNGCFIGSNAIIIQQIQVAPESVLGAGSVLLHNITEQGIYVGNPVKRI